MYFGEKFKMKRYLSLKEVLEGLNTDYKGTKLNVLRKVNPNLITFFSANPTLEQIIDLMLEDKERNGDNANTAFGIPHVLSWDYTWNTLKHWSKKKMLKMLENQPITLGAFTSIDHDHIEAIVTHQRDKRKGTGRKGALPLLLLKNGLERKGIKPQISIGGGTDIQWTKVSTVDKADGRFEFGGDDYIIYSDYKNDAGGGQSQKYTKALRYAKDYPDKRFIVLLDGDPLVKNFYSKVDIKDLSDNLIVITPTLIDRLNLVSFKIS